MRSSMTTRGHADAEWQTTALATVVGVWRWRLELGLLAVMVTVQRLLAALLGGVAAAAIVVAVAAVVVAVGPSRSALAGSACGVAAAFVGARGHGRWPVGGAAARAARAEREAGRGG